MVVLRDIGYDQVTVHQNHTDGGAYSNLTSKGLTAHTNTPLSPGANLWPTAGPASATNMPLSAAANRLPSPAPITPADLDQMVAHSLLELDAMGCV